MHPRPILKALPEPALDDPPLPSSSASSSSSHPLPFAACSTRGLLSTPHVHFPATPGLALTADAYSPGTYDRAPITVLPNSCAMPERGGRVYGSPAVSASALLKGSYFHPRAFEACEPEPVPQLVHDLSSDDSVEECVSPQSSSPGPGPRVGVAVRMQGTPYPTPIPRTHSQEEFDYALSFLPHPPAPAPQRELEKRRKSPRRSVAFADSTDTDCDGCLGGF